jgi:hypothetical protein
MVGDDRWDSTNCVLFLDVKLKLDASWDCRGHSELELVLA